MHFPSSSPAAASKPAETIEQLRKTLSSARKDPLTKYKIGVKFQGNRHYYALECVHVISVTHSPDVIVPGYVHVPEDLAAEPRGRREYTYIPVPLSSPHLSKSPCRPSG